MPTNYLFGTILTGEAVAANNRGDNLGNTTTLQKVFHNDDVHTSVSAEAIRFALRYRFQLEGLKVNREYDGERLTLKDEKRTGWNLDGDVFIDDDLMGFMDAAAAQLEAEDEAAEPAGEDQEKRKRGKGKKAKGTTTKRQSPLAVGRAVSLRPYRGELSFNAVSGEKKKNALSLYNAEMHTTEYQYSFGVNLNDVVNKSHIGALIDALVDPPQVAGNHSRFAYDFSPASIVLRVTHAHSSRIQNCFEHDESTRGVNLQRLVQRVGSGDVPAAEVIIGGEIASSPDGKRLGELGATLFPGVLAAATEARKRIAELDASLAAVGR
jgi:CRISPR-associated protein Cst2